MKLNSKVYEHRYSYWKKQLKLFWLRDLGCVSAFRIIKRVSDSSPVEVDYFDDIELESRSCLGFALYDVELIRTKQIEALESHFRGFLAKLNDKQLLHFIIGNLQYRDIILKYYKSDVRVLLKDGNFRLIR